MMCWLMILLRTFLSGCFRATPFESIIHTYVEIRCLGLGRLEKTNGGYDMFYGQVKARQESSSIKMKGCEWIWSISASAWLEVMKEEILKQFRFSQGECGWINLHISVTSWGIMPSLILWGKRAWCLMQIYSCFQNAKVHSCVLYWMCSIVFSILWTKRWPQRGKIVKIRHNTSFPYLFGEWLIRAT